MSRLLCPYLHRRGDAREVIEFYRDVFGGELVLTTFDDGGMPIDGWGEKVMHSQLTTATGVTIMASDSPPGHETEHGGDVSISLSGTDEADLRRYWDALSAGGTVHAPLDRAPWGDLFGACNDRFDVSWLVNVGTSSD